MNEQLQPLLDFIGQDFIKTACAWVVCVQTVMKLIQPPIRNVFTRAIERAVDTDDPDDDTILNRIFASKFYRAIAFTLDLIVRFKLPGTRELNEALAAKANTTKPPSNMKRPNLPIILLAGCLSLTTLNAAESGSKSAADALPSGWIVRPDEWQNGTLYAAQSGSKSAAVAWLSRNSDAGKVFNANEWQIGNKITARTEDLDHYRIGGAVELAYFPWRAAGLRLDAGMEDEDRSILDSASLTLVGRMPIDKIRTAFEFGLGAGYVTDANPWQKQDSWSIHAELRGVVRPAAHLDLFAGVRAVRPINKQNPKEAEGEHLLVFAGIAIPF